MQKKSGVCVFEFGVQTGMLAAYLTAEAADACLAHDAEELRVVWVLVADVLNGGLFVVADISRVARWERSATLKQGERERERGAEGKSP